MKIAHIIPGSGGSFYCGNCLRDSKYMKALLDLGKQVIKVPLYLPIFDDAHDLNEVPVFYGAVNTYLKQRFPLFRHMPAFVDNILDSKKVLHLAAQNAGSTRAKGLEEMTVSMLLGEEGLQKEELERMVHWLKDEAKPDIVHLSNALLIGLARRIKQEMDIPVVCSLQDEDVWVDVMSDKFREESWELMTERGKEIDAFIAVSDFYAEAMKKRLKIEDGKLFKNYIGVDAADYKVVPIEQKQPIIGFISRMCEENGLGVLVDAFIHLKEDEKYREVKLKITGGKTNDDTAFIKEQKHKIKEAKLEEDVLWVEEFEGEARQIFFDSVSLLSVPVLNGEAFGLYQLEALASGIPLVQPALGAFPEVVGLSEGGVTYHPNSAKKLSKAISSLILDKEKLTDLSKKGLAGVKEHFDVNKQAEKLVDIYEQFTKKKV
ncbi:glycosyltransferase family 4 protein [Sunxiuqinia sp. A32]|uniref:glycosyltransferase family 4 protein n=1 Tax=Sunxiuqinia sp. A32 TaxID=3461496 RepID=UPI00404687BB